MALCPWTRLRYVARLSFPSWLAGCFTYSYFSWQLLEEEEVESVKGNEAEPPAEAEAKLEDAEATAEPKVINLQVTSDEMG